MRIFIVLFTVFAIGALASWAYLTGRLPSVTIPGVPTTPVTGTNVFKNNVVAEFLAPDKATDTYRDIKLVQPFGYIDPRGVSWDVPAGYVTNGASIPTSLWAVVGGPFDGPYRDAAVLHDYYCEAKLRSSDDTHLMYYEASVARGTSANLASTMYAGLILGGPKWVVVGTPKKAGFDVLLAQTKTETNKAGTTVTVDPGLTNKAANPAQLQAAEDLKEWILKEHPTLEQIKKRAEEMRQQTGISK